MSTQKVIPPELLDDAFWRTAVNPLSAFWEDAETEFRRGLIDGNEDDLAWSRLVIHDFADHAAWPVVIRLMQLAPGAPKAEFVECLVFFLSGASSLPRLRAGIDGLSDARLAEALELADALKSSLLTNDSLLAPSIDGLLNLLAEAVQTRQSSS